MLSSNRLSRMRATPRLLLPARHFGSKTSNRSTAALHHDLLNDQLPYGGVLQDQAGIHKTDISKKSGKLIILSDMFDRPLEGMTEESIASRNRFVKSKVHIASLLDALISGGHLRRADATLPRAFEFLTPEQFSSLRNDYLKAFVQKDIEDNHNIEDSIAWLEASVSRFEDIPIDAAAYAILISGACKMADGLKSWRHIDYLMNKYVKDGGSPKDILQLSSHFTFRQARDLMKRFNMSENDLPQEFRADPFRVDDHERDTSRDSNRKASFQDVPEDKDLPRDVFKQGVESLTPVQTRGLKLLRGSLQGISASSRPQIPLLSTAGIENASVTDNGFLNFQDQLLLLPEEERKQYEEAFESYNMDRQLALESLALETAKERWRGFYEEAQQRGQFSSTKVSGYLWEWHVAMTEQVKEELKRVEAVLDNALLVRGSHSDRQRLRYGPFFKLLGPEKLSVITIMETIKLTLAGGVTEGHRTTRVLVSIGRAIEMEYNSVQLQRASQHAAKHKTGSKTEIRRSIYAARRASESSSNWKSEWPDAVKVDIASVLVSILMQVARISVTAVDPVTNKKVSALVPILTHSYQYTGGSKLGVLKLHPDFARKLQSDPAHGMLHPQQLPMLVKPKPWAGYNNGGYYYSTTMLMRTKDSAEQLAYIKEASRRNDLKDIYEGLDVLGSAAWVINSRIYNVLSKVWNSGENFLEIPKQVGKEIQFPPEPAVDAEPSVRRDWARKSKLMIHDRMKDHSIRCDVNYKLEISRAFLGERMYFPHNIDFRGRAYAIPPHLNHLGNDMCRGLLMFWEAKPLGERGLRWLKIHLANVCGYDKADFQSRVEYVEEHLDDVFDSADHPLEGRRWWMKASDPWQALAACFELSDALRSADPLAFKSRLPVHQDGTCNGLQHYAALGGDVEGARQVNLEPSDKPQDIYTHVANKVNEKVNADAAKGIHIAKILQGKVSRKVVKQSVMTNVYGVTYVGARAQILKQLKDLTDIPEEYIWKAAAYLTTYVFETVRTLFNGAHLIQDWLGECARRISRSVPMSVGADLKAKTSMTSVIWTTPLGLPVVQPYRATVRKQILTQIQTVFISDPNAIYPVNSRKQVTAFAPNFIHSLDATHMLLSALACGRNGLTFAAVHDSYWTHPSDIDKMNTVLRDAFVKLHEGNLVKRLKEEFEIRYAGYLHYIEIDPLTPEAEAIVQWRRDLRASMNRPITVRDEIEAEAKRQRLLKSEDPNEVAEGKKLVTPISIIGDKDIETLIMKRKQVTSRKQALSRRSIKSTENEKAGNSSESVIRSVMGLPDQKASSETADIAFEDEVVGSDPELSDSEGDVKKEAEEDDEGFIEPRAESVYQTTMKGTPLFYPLSFPEVPPRGSFDVNTLKDSLYFFS